MRVVRNKRFNEWAKRLSPPSQFDVVDRGVRYTFFITVGGGGCHVEATTETRGARLTFVPIRVRTAFKLLGGALLANAAYHYMEDGGLHDRLTGLDWDDGFFDPTDAEPERGH